MLSTPKDGGVTTSLWMDTQTPVFPGTAPGEVDVLVIGAGIAGLTCAVELARAGRQVTVIDDGPIGGGETGRTSAHLTSAVDDRYYEIASRFGADGAKIVAESHAAAIDYIERMVKERAIECDFQRVDGYLFEPPGDRPRTHEELEKELVAATDAGLSCELVESAPLPFATGPALKFVAQAEFHPLKYLRGLADYACELGVVIHTGVHAEAIEPDPTHEEGALGKPLRVLVTGSEPIRASIVVDATNGDMSSSFKMWLQQAAYRSYVVAFAIPLGTIPHALYWETGDAYRYIRVARGEDGGDVLIVGGEDHRVGQSHSGTQFEALEQWTREYIPAVGRVVATWSGQIMEPVDGPAHIGKSPTMENVYLCTGDSGEGLTHGTIAGLMIPQLVAGNSSAWERVYDPNRNHAHAAGKYLSEAGKTVAPYLDWIRGGDVQSIDEIPRGQGALLRRGLGIVAAYRDDAGECHLMSAACPHMKGVVQWNGVEKTWDCPCHGSRFDAYGTVLNGPAVTNMTSAEAPGEAPVATPALQAGDSFVARPGV